MTIESLAVSYINAKFARRAAKAAYLDRRSRFLKDCPIAGFSEYDRLDIENKRHKAALAATAPEWEQYQDAVYEEKKARQKLERAVLRVSKRNHSDRM